MKAYTALAEHCMVQNEKDFAIWLLMSKKYGMIYIIIIGQFGCLSVS